MRAPLLIRFLLLHAAIGIGAGWLMLAGLMATNAGGLADLVFGSAAPPLPLAMLMFGTAVTFGSAAMGAGIMLLPYDGRGTGRKRRVAPLRGWARPAATPARG